MPLYDFACDSCGGGFEAIVSMKEKESQCPACGAPARRLISAPHFDIRMGLDPVGNPTMGDKWAKLHEKAAMSASARRE